MHYNNYALEYYYIAEFADRFVINRWIQRYYKMKPNNIKIKVRKCSAI